MVKLGTGGRVSLYNSAGNANLLADVVEEARAADRGDTPSEPARPGAHR
jgi:hypothetical protein